MQIIYYWDIGTSLRLVPEWSWYQPEVGTSFKLVPAVSWYQHEVGTGLKLVPAWSWYQPEVGTSLKLVPVWVYKSIHLTIIISVGRIVAKAQSRRTTWKHGRCTQNWGWVDYYNRTHKQQKDNSSWKIPGGYHSASNIWFKNTFWIIQVKLTVLKKKTQGGQEVKILQEEREFMVINNQRIYRNEGNSSLHNIKL